LTDPQMDVTQCDFSSDSGVVVLGDLTANNDVELYSTTDLATSDQLLARIPTSPVLPSDLRVHDRSSQ
jgi:hypothetical protein